ncbi:MAG: 2'-5' RNA ligase family protein [Nocardioidaceae bacterium]|nr:2'-5' RNA ligase family protein [Nocardioidaceae bacterium]
MPTIGVALAIPEPWGRQLQDYRVSVGDDSAVGIPSHVTLMPPVETTTEELAEVRGHLADVAASFASFQVRLRGTGTFRPISPVVFVMVAEGISACEQLASQIREGPLDIDLQFPYHPHVTVAHHLDDEVLDRAFSDLADFECVFRAGAFHLYEHDERFGWRPTTEFALAPASDDR